MSRLPIPTLICLLLVGCGESTTPTNDAAGENASETSQQAPTGSESTDSYDTPEAAYAAMQQAVANKNWKAVASLLSRESQSMLAGMSVMASSFATISDDGQEDPVKAKELQELLARNGIDLDAEEAEPTEEELAAGPEAMMMKMTKSIPDLPAFIAEINAWIEKNSDQKGGAFPEMGDLTELNIEENKATAKSETEFGQQPIEFRKTDTGWIVHLPLGGPPEPSMSDFDQPDDGTPGIGTFSLGDRSAKLRHAIAYPSMYFDEPCTVVLITAQPLPERQIVELKEMLQEEGNDDRFFARGTHLKLSYDDAGELVSLFAWADNYSINGTGGVVADFTRENGRAKGSVTMAEPEEFLETTYRFEAEFDAELLPVSAR